MSLLRLKKAGRYSDFTEHVFFTPLRMQAISSLLAVLYVLIALRQQQVVFRVCRMTFARKVDFTKCSTSISIIKLAELYIILHIG